MRLIGTLPVLALAIALPLAAQDSAKPEPGKARPLFATDAPLEMEISAPLRDLARRAKDSTDPFPATLRANGETHTIELSPRGVSRRKSGNCKFPPLRVEFTTKPADSSLFDGQKRLKLVVHCNDNTNFEQMVLREYAAYKLYNALTHESFKVRLAKVRYLDDGKEMTERWGFFIEDTDDVAKRMGGKEIEVSRIPSSALNSRDAARVALFQYLVGNADWEMIAGPAGTDCCHNAKLVGATKESVTDLTPLPYDFDYTGLVDAPYAVPAPQLGIRSVRQRAYWGFCKHNDDLLAVAPEFRAARPAMQAELAAIPGLSSSTLKKLTSYVDDFFEDIATPDTIEKKILKNCR